MKPSTTNLQTQTDEQRGSVRPVKRQNERTKNDILPALKLTLYTIIFFSGIYTVFVWGVAQAVPGKGEGVTVTAGGRVVGYALIGQSFTQDKYFQSRPSAVGYNAAGSGGSNKGPSNPDYLKDVQSRIDTLLAHNPGLKKEEIPSELVTASGSGQDPNLSPAAARIQVARIARVRNIGPDRISALVDSHIEGPLFGFLGTSKVNLLKLNIDLDGLH